MNHHVELLILAAYLRLDDIDDTVHDLAERDLIHIERHLPALNLGHIQHVVDKSQKMLAGEGDLAQAVLNLLLVVDICCGNRRHSDNRVHRRPDVMAHIGQKFTLGPGCLNGFLSRLVKRDHLLARQL